MSRVAAAIDRYLLPAPDLSSKPAGRRCCCRSTGQTNGRTDGHPTVLWRLLHALRNAYQHSHESMYWSGVDERGREAHKFIRPIEAATRREMVAVHYADCVIANRITSIRNGVRCIYRRQNQFLSLCTVSCSASAKIILGKHARALFRLRITPRKL